MYKIKNETPRFILLLFGIIPADTFFDKLYKKYLTYSLIIFKKLKVKQKKKNIETPVFTIRNIKYNVPSKNIIDL